MIRGLANRGANNGKPNKVDTSLSGTSTQDQSPLSRNMAKIDFGDRAEEMLSVYKSTSEQDSTNAEKLSKCKFYAPGGETSQSSLQTTHNRYITCDIPTKQQESPRGKFKSTGIGRNSSIYHKILSEKQLPQLSNTSSNKSPGHYHRYKNRHN